jgi:hypothetical protein
MKKEEGSTAADARYDSVVRDEGLGTGDSEEELA